MMEVHPVVRVLCCAYPSSSQRLTIAQEAFISVRKKDISPLGVLYWEQLRFTTGEHAAFLPRRWISWNSSPSKLGSLSRMHACFCISIGWHAMQVAIYASANTS